MAINVSKPEINVREELKKLNGKLDKKGKAADSLKFDGLKTTSFFRTDIKNTLDLTIEKTNPKLVLHDSDSAQGTYPTIEFRSDTSQHVQIFGNEFDVELPAAGYGIVMGPTSDNTQVASHNMMLVVQGDIYAGNKNSTLTHKVWHAGNDGSGSTLDSDLLDGLHASSFLRSDADSTTNNKLTVKGNLETFGSVFNSSSDLQTIGGYLAAPKGYGGGSGLEFRFDTSQTAYAVDDQGATITVTKGTSPSTDVLKDLFNYTNSYFNLISYKDANNTFEIELTGISLSNSSNTTWRPYVLFHTNGGSVANVKIQFLAGDGTTWVTSYDGACSNIVAPKDYTSVSPGVLKGMRITFTGITGNPYLKMIGATSLTSDSFAWQMLKSGGAFYGSILGKRSGLERWRLDRDGGLSFTANALGTLPNSTPMGIARQTIQSYGTMTFNADTDGSTTEYLYLTAGYGAGTGGNSGLRIGYAESSLEWKGYRIHHDNYKPSADKWTTARTITLGGDLTGSVSLDGSANVTLNAAAAKSITIAPDGPSGDFNAQIGNSYVSALNATANSPFGNAWYNLVNIRHRGGSGDGNVWGAQIAIGMTAYSDKMAFRAHRSSGWEAWRQVYTDTYRPAADKWTTARTLTLTGDTQGSVSIDGSANVSLSTNTKTLTVRDARNDGDVTPVNLPNYQAAFTFSDDIPYTPYTWNSVMSVKGWNGSSYSAWQLIGPADTTVDDNLYFRSGINTSWNGLRKIWHDGNDGAGSGLDADTVDGLEAAVLVTTTTDQTILANHTFTGNGLKLSGHFYTKQYDANGNVYFHVGDGNSTNSNGTKLNLRVYNNTGGHRVLYLDGNTGAITWNGSTVWTQANDGTGSGMDADLLDGLHASSFLRSDTNTTLNGGLIIEGNIDSGGSNFGFYESVGTNLILKGDSNGRSGIFFQSEKNGTNINHSTDYGFIQYHAYGFGGTTGEANQLVIGVANDSTDEVILQSPYNGGVKVGYRDVGSGTGLTTAKVYHDNYRPNADKWTTARTLTLGGDLSGSVSFDGSGNVTLTSTATDALVRKVRNDWYSTGTYVYDSTNGTRYYYMKIANIGSGVFGSIEYYAHGDSNYPRAVRGYIDISSMGTTTMSIKHNQISSDPYGVQVFLDNNNDVWMRVPGCAWGHLFEYRLASGSCTMYSGIRQEAAPANSYDVSSVTTEYRFNYGAASSGPISTYIGVQKLGKTTIEGYNAYHDNYKPSADKWTTARTITLSNNLSGSVSLDGSANVTLSGTVLDSQKLGGLSRSASDTASTIAERNTSGDIYARLFRTTYPDQGTVPTGATVMMRQSPTDDYIRPITASAFMGWLKNYDGSGSGLDADLLDGLSSSQFLRADVSDTLTGNLNVNTLHVVDAKDWNQNGLRITGTAPSVYFNDTSVGVSNGFFGMNTGSFYWLADRNRDGTFTTPYPMQLSLNSPGESALSVSGEVNLSTTLRVSSDWSTTGFGSGNNAYGVAISSVGVLYVSRATTCASFNRAGTGRLINYRSDGTEVGGINVTSSGTTYLTSSDYRLKNNVQPLGDATSRLMKLKPSRFEFIKEPGVVVDGFLAHEVQETIPEAVSGVKDGIDVETGEPEYQAIDHSRLVPLLTAALQDAFKKIEELEARIGKLEAK
jgi:hypothetical protein